MTDLSVRVETVTGGNDPNNRELHLPKAALGGSDGDHYAITATPLPWGETLYSIQLNTAGDVLLEERLGDVDMEEGWLEYTVSEAPLLQVGFEYPAFTRPLPGGGVVLCLFAAGS